MKYIVLRDSASIPNPKAPYPFVGWFLKDDTELQNRLGNDILAGDIIIEIPEDYQRVMPARESLQTHKSMNL